MVPYIVAYVKSKHIKKFNIKVWPSASAFGQPCPLRGCTIIHAALEALAKTVPAGGRRCTKKTGEKELQTLAERLIHQEGDPSSLAAEVLQALISCNG